MFRSTLASLLALLVLLRGPLPLHLEKNTGILHHFFARLLRILLLLPLTRPYFGASRPPRRFRLFVSFGAKAASSCWKLLTSKCLAADFTRCSYTGLHVVGGLRFADVPAVSMLPKQVTSNYLQVLFNQLLEFAVAHAPARLVPGAVSITA